MSALVMTKVNCILQGGPLSRVLFIHVLELMFWYLDGPCLAISKSPIKEVTGVAVRYTLDAV